MKYLWIMVGAFVAFVDQTRSQGAAAGTGRADLYSSR